MTLDSDLRSIQEMRIAVNAAKQAQKELESFSQSRIDEIVKAISNAAFKQAEKLARLAVEETGIGVVEHKKIKNEVCAKDVYESIKDIKTVGIVNRIPTKKMVEIASPFGIIAGIVPVTNPTSTAIFKSLIAIKARNAIVFSPHPTAARCTVEAAKICAEAAVAAGAPEGIIGWISTPTMDATEQLMKHRDIHLILSTGGSGLVKAAYSSGKPAYGVGPGNVPVYIEKSANVQKAVRLIVDSKTFDNGTICASEQAVVVDKSIREMAIRAFKDNGSYVLNDEEKKLMESVISPTLGKLNPKIVGKSAAHIANLAGITVPKGTKLLIAEEQQINKRAPFSIEKLSPILALYQVEDETEALKVCTALLELGGKGHTLAIHSNDEQLVQSFAIHSPVSRIVVNTPSALGAVGASTALKPSMTLGCGTFGGNITSDNLTVSHLMNVKRVAYGIKDIQVPEPKQEASFEKANIDQIIEEVLNKVGPNEKIDTKLVAELVKEALQHH